MNKPSFKKQNSSKIVEDRRKKAEEDERIREEQEKRAAEEKRQKLRSIFTSLPKETQNKIIQEAKDYIKSLNITRNADVLEKGKIASIVERDYFNK